MWEPKTKQQKQDLLGELCGGTSEVVTATWIWCHFEPESIRPWSFVPPGKVSLRSSDGWVWPKLAPAGCVHASVVCGGRSEQCSRRLDHHLEVKNINPVWCFILFFNCLQTLFVFLTLCSTLFSHSCVKCVAPMTLDWKRTNSSPKPVGLLCVLLRYTWLTR